MSQSPAEKIINRFIANNPQNTLDFLKGENIPISENPTLDEITEALYPKYFENDKAFNTRLGEFIANGGNIGFVITTSLVIAIISAAGVGVTGTAAAAKFARDKRIAENKAEIEKFRIQITSDEERKAARDKVVSEQITNYTTALQEESSKRRTNAIIFVAGAAVLGIMAVIILRK
jgi:hypothetical protein